MKTAVLVFSKVPLPGRTKSRLGEKLTAFECALVHRACLDDMHRELKKTGCKGFLYYTGGSEQDFLSPFAGEIPAGFDNLRKLNFDGFEFKLQKGRDLGERMYHAARETLKCFQQIIILGSDLPGISCDLIIRTQELLAQSSVVLGPAADGGYYLIGLKKAYEKLFCNISWGSERVLLQTMEAAGYLGLSASMLPEKRDVDRWGDLLFYGNLPSEDLDLGEQSALRLAHYLKQKYTMPSMEEEKLENDH
ncbi:MAG: TIGR04282 family arsenosugar biosynthesis glycosyltransferase [Desulfitobacteriaceae bacterium]|nr:TIGR04282 family arsenosugar biosynthesis glycosyltransferase [Desulfitobacteriaceae bacterium]NMA14583.1 glycosyltransferase [Clostridia bacterium]